MFLRTATETGGAPAAPAVPAGGPAATTPPAAAVPGISGPSSPQPAGGSAPLDPAKPAGGGSPDSAGNVATPDRSRQIEQSRFVGTLQNENAELRRQLEALKTAAPAPAAAPQPAVPLAVTPAEPTGFDERTYRSQLMKDPAVKEYLAELDEVEDGDAQKERYLRGLIIQGRINHNNSQALLQRTESIELENMSAAIDREFQQRHPDFKNDSEHQAAFDKTLERLAPVMANPKSAEGQLALMELIHDVSLLQFLPQIIETKAKAMAEDMLKRGTARTLAGGTTAGGAAPGTPGAPAQGKRVPWEN